MLSAGQLRWRCRRGVRELDVVFDDFLRSEYSKLNNSERSGFEALLEVQDPIIMDWLFGKSKPDDKNILNIIKRLQSISGLKDSG
jgi:antitoxin CptB